MSNQTTSPPGWHFPEGLTSISLHPNPIIDYERRLELAEWEARIKDPNYRHVFSVPNERFVSTPSKRP